jgi:anti-sigma B factor antagonist
VRTSDREVDVLEDVVIQLGKYCSMRSERHVGTTIVRLAGEFDLACKEPFQEELSLVLDRETVIFILDLRGLQFMDSTGLGTLVELDGLARRDGFEFTILCDQGLVRRALQETGLDGMLPVADPYGGLLPPSDSPV